MTTNERHALAHDLLGRALCQTDSPADAVSALMVAAGELLHARFGPARAVELLRETIEATEAAMIDRFGQRTGKVAQ